MRSVKCTLRISAVYIEDCKEFRFSPTNFSTLAVEVTRQLYSVLSVPEQTKIRLLWREIYVYVLPTKNTGGVPPLHQTVSSLPG